MENLNHLTKLEILILTGNKITSINNIDDLNMLTIFSIAGNQLERWDHVLYLRHFKNLRSVNVAGNPCTIEDKYFSYFVALLPQVIYYCYVIISENQRSEAQKEHRLEIRRVENAEEIAQTDLEQREILEKKIALDSSAFVDQLDGNKLFLHLLEHDKDGSTSKTFNDDTQRAFDDYERNFSAICHDLYELGLRQYHERQEEVKKLSESVHEAQNNVRDDSREIIGTIFEYKQEIITKFNSEIGQSDNSSKSVDVNPQVDVKLTKFQSYTENFEQFLASKWIKLIQSEVILHDQIEDVNKTFKINMSDMCNSAVESAGAAFAQMRLTVDEYHDTIKKFVNSNDKNFPEHLKNFSDDVETLNNALTVSRDMHMQVINSRENTFADKINIWLDDLMARLHKQEYDRHRRRVLEISHFLQYEKEEMRHYLLANSPLGLEIIAALED